MGRKKLGRVWLKRRKNPAKQDGTRTVSYTLQYRDLGGKERFFSLGKKVTNEEEAKGRQQWLQLQLIEPWSDTPREFAKQFWFRYRDAYQVLSDFTSAGGHIGFIGSVVEANWKMHQPPDALAEFLVGKAAKLRYEWDSDPDALVWQLRNRHPEEFETYLIRCLQNNIDPLDEVKRLSLFQTPEEIAKKLLAYAKESRWSKDPSEFARQIRERYPEEYRAISQEFDIPAAMETATLDPWKIVDKLIEYARGQYDHTWDDKGRISGSESRSAIPTSESDSRK